MAKTKNHPASATSAKTTVKKLSEKLTSEKAIKFLQEERKNKELAALEVYKEAMVKIDKLGCSVGVNLTLDAENKVIPHIVIRAKQ